MFFSKLIRLFLLFGVLALNCSAYKILVFSPTLSRSHMISNGRVADALASDEHDVTLVEIQYAVPLDVLNLALLKEQKFDVIISEQLNFCGAGVGHLLNIPINIILCSTSLQEHVTSLIGLPFPSSYVPSLMDSNVPDKMSLVQRFQNLMRQFVGYNYNFYGIDPLTQIFQKHFGIDFPDLRSIVNRLPDQFGRAIRTMLDDPSFGANAKRTKKLLSTKPFTAKERLLKNMRFLEMNGGELPELLSESRNMSVVQLYNLDLAMLATLALLTLLIILRYLAKFALASAILAKSLLMKTKKNKEE
uniref:glucuronosyltransferase n=1 Tax=Globodera pallida TaxID=36090 RepID=A0A183BSN5_GLOPA